MSRDFTGDCYTEQLPGEPHFTLLGRDPLAGFLVSIWSSLRYGDVEAASVKFRAMIERGAAQYLATPDIAGADGAIEIAMAMFDWRKANDGRWRSERAPPREVVSEQAVRALTAAVHALRSYEYGNGAPDLAREVAAAGTEALKAIGRPLGSLIDGPKP